MTFSKKLDKFHEKCAFVEPLILLLLGSMLGVAFRLVLPPFMSNAHPWLIFAIIIVVILSYYLCFSTKRLIFKEKKKEQKEPGLEELKYNYIHSAAKDMKNPAYDINKRTEIFEITMKTSITWSKI